ncbi:hypothetical protein OG520_39990 (plasmid) [Streptomyces sp. NBC_00984]|uniref:hypothetical protein n=1 Tax=Streptomyces sp. NBC_00984 TaxID=2903700 RepID=UPI002F9136B7|nr:hypothetical protein OG520_39990 [Streptomyces sp. NBC_00984]
MSSCVRFTGRSASSAGSIPDILQEPLLCGQELFPPEPLRRHPPPEVFALHDHFPGHHRQGPVVLEQVLDEAETPLPPRIPYRV